MPRLSKRNKSTKNGIILAHTPKHSSKKTNTTVSFYCEKCDALVRGILIKGTYSCKNCGSVLSVCNQPIKRACKGCGKKLPKRGAVYGYCNVYCFRKYDPKLYLIKGYVFPSDEAQRIPFYKYGILYEPITEDDVVFLFAKLHKKLGFNYINLTYHKYPDCVAIDTKKHIVRIEFEYLSSRFNHNPDGCDVVICWEHDWKGCPKKVISLKEYVGINGSRLNNKSLLDY